MLAVFKGEEIVVVALATPIGKELAALDGSVKEPTRLCCATWSDFFRERTLLCKS